VIDDTSWSELSVFDAKTLAFSKVCMGGEGETAQGYARETQHEK
jgi:hypothetical protein